MTKLKRNHESKVQDMIEHRFSRMRELLKERGSSLSSKKNKEFDMFKRRISEVISKLDDILVEHEQIATFGINEESLSSLKDRLESLLSENHQLRDLLTDKKREVKFLSQQVSEAAEKMSEHSLAEAKLLKTTANLNATIEDAHIEALIREDAFSCILRGIMDQIKCMAEESQVEYNLLQEIYKSTFKEAAHNGEPTGQCEIEDLNVESIIMQELYVVVFRETLNDAEQKLNNLKMKYTNENQLRLKQEVLFLAEEKEQLAQDATAALEKEKERYELAAQELENLRDETFQQQKLISEGIEESNAARRNLVLALEQIEIHKAEICKLDQKLELAMKELGEVNEERRMLLDVNQEKHNAVSLFEAKERELKEQLKSIAVYSSGLLKAVTDFECRVTQDISGKCSRLKRLSSQSHSLKEKANVLLRRGSLYKQRFERKCSDLEKAEAEVDLLGDEVDTLLSLVEKIYIGLDHYSPILQHYPGITEVLKLQYVTGVVVRQLRSSNHQRIQVANLMKREMPKGFQQILAALHSEPGFCEIQFPT
ncbi:WPP domain-associated protein [Prunus yedoensis var. nudiflora]|uniref:WPP domain-associated protein n=1 Tax=Prunus yedoensis var. nudiflora TaxID=2094558 RepID=A0A314ZWA7_PRUYE|nr:WPP domain-associated protein [Prunus yedoensis var. nudiflora]